MLQQDKDLLMFYAIKDPKDSFQRTWFVMTEVFFDNENKFVIRLPAQNIVKLYENSNTKIELM